MCTANSLDTIPGPLRDRMEIIELSSYTAQEKLHIAEEHLLEKQRKRHGLTAKQLKIKADAMEEIIDGYTREAGVRQLERTIGEVCRKAVKMILSGEKNTYGYEEKSGTASRCKKIYAGYNLQRAAGRHCVWSGMDKSRRHNAFR